MAFDINQPYGVVSGDGSRAHYIQGGLYYDKNGVQVSLGSTDPLATQPSLRDHHAAHQAMGNVVNYTIDPLTGGITNISKLTQAMYDALPVKDASTLYVIVP